MVYGQHLVHNPVILVTISSSIYYCSCKNYAYHPAFLLCSWQCLCCYNTVQQMITCHPCQHVQSLGSTPSLSAVQHWTTWRMSGISTPIPIATVAKTARILLFPVQSCFRISSFICLVCGEWSCANSLFAGIEVAPGGKYWSMPRTCSNSLYAKPHKRNEMYIIVRGYAIFCCKRLLAIGIRIDLMASTSWPVRNTFL